MRIRKKQRWRSKWPGSWWPCWAFRQPVSSRWDELCITPDKAYAKRADFGGCTFYTQGRRLTLTRAEIEKNPGPILQALSMIPQERLREIADFIAWQVPGPHWFSRNASNRLSEAIHRPPRGEDA